jgi:hypothetical protein
MLNGHNMARRGLDRGHGGHGGDPLGGVEAKRPFRQVATKTVRASRSGAHHERCGELGESGGGREWPVHGEALAVALLPAVEKTGACGQSRTMRGATKGSRDCA